MSTPLSRAVHRANGRLNTTRRHHPDTDHVPLEQDLATARVMAAVVPVMEKAPALTAEQVASVVAVLQHQDRTAVGDAA